MYRNLVCLAGGIAVALYLFLPAPFRLYVPGAFAVPAAIYVLAPLAYWRLVRGVELEGRELFGAGLLTIFLALLAVLPFLEGSVALACVVAAALVLWYAGLPTTEAAEDVAESTSES
jgi:dolichol kinase